VQLCIFCFFFRFILIAFLSPLFIQRKGNKESEGANFARYKAIPPSGLRRLKVVYGGLRWLKVLYKNNCAFSITLSTTGSFPLHCATLHFLFLFSFYFYFFSFSSFYSKEEKQKKVKGLILPPQSPSPLLRTPLSRILLREILSDFNDLLHKLRYCWSFSSRP
jgi:hypothetical protein